MPDASSNGEVRREVDPGDAPSTTYSVKVSQADGSTVTMPIEVAQYIALDGILRQLQLIRTEVAELRNVLSARGE